MKTEKNILIAFLLNLFFALLECVGGILTGSIAIASDAVHDLADAASIGISFFLEKKSKRQPDKTHTYGYARYSVLGSIIVTLFLIFGSAVVGFNAVIRIANPVPIHYDGMIFFACIGAAVNLCAAWFTRGEGSLNQKAVNLHMLEDVLGWLVVLLGAIVMRITDISILDPLLSLGVAVFILVHAIQNLRQAIDLFLEKTPSGIHVEEIQQHLLQLDGVQDVHHIHIWSMDGSNHYATVHIVTSLPGQDIKKAVRAELAEHGICHCTLELETPEEHCNERTCSVKEAPTHHHHHHH